jgi:exopolysaccharide biosynthesis WecB/TagA/CpsF family protein
MVAPDGQPVRWALNAFHGAGLKDRVYGPELMLRLCEKAAEAGVGVYLYGSEPEVVSRLSENLIERFGRLRIVGAESPPFRALSEGEVRAAAGRINASGAGIVFVGLGLPRQDHFAYELRGHIRAVQVCVGAAFDFHAKTKRMAPGWMQRCGLEWLFRLMQEPGRLWRRYLGTNSVFVLLVLRRVVMRH